MGPKKKYSRLYSQEYLVYGFIESPVHKLMPVCLLCHKSFSNEAMKPSRLVEHLNTKHPDKKDKPIECFQDIAEQFTKRKTIILYFKGPLTRTKMGSLLVTVFQNLLLKVAVHTLLVKSY